MTQDALIAAVLADADVLHALLSAPIRIAGPWIRTERSSSRKQPSRNVDLEIVEVQKIETAWDVTRPYTTSRPGSSDHAWSRSFASQGEAEAWLDGRLQAEGWRLATEATNTIRVPSASAPR